MMFRLLLVLCTSLLIGCGSSSTSPTDTTSGTIVRQLISPTCVDVGYVYYAEQGDTYSYFDDIKNINPYWDVRYHTPNAHNSCVSGVMNFSSVIDLTIGSVPVEFGGPQSTLIYKLTDAFAWRYGDNLSIQVIVDAPIYNNIGGGGLYINLFIININTKERLNYVITIHSLGSAWTTEQVDVLYDSTTSTNFISTIINPNTEYISISPVSSITNSTGDNNFYRVNITKEDLTKAVNNPEDWYVSFIGIQYELEESLGESKVAMSFRDFSAYITKGVI